MFWQEREVFKTRFDDSIALAIAILFGVVPVYWAFATFWGMPNAVVLVFCQLVPMILIMLVINKVTSRRWREYPEHFLWLYR
ncbi:hypothetical protein [Helicobacter sp. L8]|uniref:hypothetical protein n=1 Tax=Helicobacter sp. L8 TaxID=2316078 RepID=UPI000EB51E31|nr:hypothetical protein [Helicobacter sp. L8]